METGSNHRHTSVIIANYAPFRLVLRESDTWQPTLEQVNGLNYDYVKLCRLSTFIDVGIRPLSLGICFDGTLILPATEQFQDAEKALDKFNETLGIMLLGGLYSEAVNAEDLTIGSLFFDGYLKMIGRGRGANTSFHAALQSQSLGPMDSVRILEPRVVSVSELQEAYSKGSDIFKKIGGLSPSLLLNGVSGYVKKQWVEGHIFAWTAIEQVIGIMWKREILSKIGDDEIEGRKRLLEDYRTWTTSTKIELLFQKGLIGIDEYNLLNTARKARNEFVHRAKPLSLEKVKAAIDGLFRLISLVISFYKDAELLSPVLESVYKNEREGLYPQKRVFSNSEVKYWRHIPPVPGDSHWKGEYEIIDELVLKPLRKPNE